MKECIFCKIINGELPSKTIYEDDLIKIIMNINPATNGHLLVLPKEHYVNLFDLDEKILNHSIKVIKEKIYKELKVKLNCEGMTLAKNNELGQEIKHYQIHIIPRYQNDNADYNYDKSKLDDLEAIFNKLTK